MAESALPTRSPGPALGHWIVSPQFDLAMVIVPFAIALLSLLTLGANPGEIPLWSFLILIVAFDVAHVWATGYVTYLDPEAIRRRWVLLFLPIPIAFFAAYRLHLHSPQLFWTLLAYVAIYHFVKQQYGFIALYKARAGEWSRFDYYLDKWSLWVGALGPILIWHAGPAKEFNWFNHGEHFIVRVPDALIPEIAALMVGVCVLWLGRQAQLYLRDDRVNPGKLLWMVGSWISWAVGIGLSDNLIISAAFVNLFHGIPFLLLVWYRINRRHDADTETPPSRFLGWIARRKNWLFFYGFVLVVAVVEEALWDGIVWKTYLPGLLGWSVDKASAHALAFWVALLSLPQVVHYYLDAWIWKLDGSNPELRGILRLE